MKILLIRHGDPNYENDSLTEKGKKEAAMLASRLINEKIDYAYVSPLGRARETAAPTLAAKGMEEICHDWLREFSDCRIVRPDLGGPSPVCWDWLPEDWTKYEDFYRYDKWFDQDNMAAADAWKYAKEVFDGIDELLAKHGYVHKGHVFEARRANDDTIALFCHFGVGCLIIGYLLGISPMPLWQGLVAAPTSVTTIVTEERREGTASFRMSCYGDTTHLYINNEKPSFAARFCEMYSNKDERHD